MGSNPTPSSGSSICLRIRACLVHLHLSLLGAPAPISLYLYMVVSARVEFLRQCIKSGYDVTVHCSINSTNNVEKLKFLLKSSSGGNYVSSRSAEALLDYIHSSELSPHFSVVDRGHKHTNGVSEVAFYVRCNLALAGSTDCEERNAVSIGDLVSHSDAGKGATKFASQDAQIGDSPAISSQIHHPSVQPTCPAQADEQSESGSEFEFNVEDYESFLCKATGHNPNVTTWSKMLAGATAFLMAGMSFEEVHGLFKALSHFYPALPSTVLKPLMQAYLDELSQGWHLDFLES